MNKKINFTITLVFIIVFVYLFIFSPISIYFDQNHINYFISEFGILAPMIFIFVYIITHLILIPGIPITILGGVLFGPIFGTIYVVISATLAATIAFLLARHYSFNKHEIKHKFINKIIKKFDYHCENHGFRTFFILRLLYVPFIPLSYAAGFIAKIKLKDFVLATFFANLVTSFTFVYFGSNLNLGLKALLIPIILIALTFLIPYLIKKL